MAVLRERDVEPIAMIEAALPAGDSWGVLDTMKSWLDSFRPLPTSVVAELKQLYTVRLTHHSNALEGNTLSQHETEMVFSHGMTIGGKTMIEHLGVIGYRDAMQYMGELAAQSTPVGKCEIRNLHSLLLAPADGASGVSQAGRPGESGCYRNSRYSGGRHRTRIPAPLPGARNDGRVCLLDRVL